MDESPPAEHDPSGKHDPSGEHDPSSKATPLDANAPVSPARGPSPARQPRLGIAHLLAWTLGSGLMLALLPLPSGPPAGGVPAGGPTAGRSVVYLFYGLVYGAALSSLPLPLLRRWRHGPGFPRQPGHWLLVTNGLIALVICGTIVFWDRTAVASSRLALQAFGTALPAGLYLAGAVAADGGARWTVVLSLLGSLHVVMAASLGGLALLASAPPTGLEMQLWGLFQVVQSYGTLAAGFLLMGAALSDVYRQADRDWLHWTGVFVELATIVWITFGIFGRLPVLL